jgi:hypothetical protein
MRQIMYYSAFPRCAWLVTAHTHACHSIETRARWVLISELDICLLTVSMAFSQIPSHHLLSTVVSSCFIIPWYSIHDNHDMSNSRYYCTTSVQELQILRIRLMNASGQAFYDRHQYGFLSFFGLVWSDMDCQWRPRIFQVETVLGLDKRSLAHVGIVLTCPCLPSSHQQIQS